MTSNNSNNGRDQFIGNRNISAGEGDIHDYGGVRGNVNSGSGSQTHVRTGDISGNQGNIAVGTGISQTNVSGPALHLSPEVRTLRRILRQASDDLFDLPISGDERNTVRGALNAAISALESGQVSEQTYLALSNAVDALAYLNIDTRQQRKAITQAAAAAGWEL